jgi:hypothetical protein
LIFALLTIGGGIHQSSTPSTSNPTLHAYPSLIPSSQPSKCEDEADWFYDYTPTGAKLGCGVVMNNPEKLCAKIGHFSYKRKTAYLACCMCGE